MRYFLMLPATLALAACATTADRLETPVFEVFHSPQSATAVAGCFEAANHIRAIEQADGGRVISFRNGYGGITRSFTIYPDGAGSRIDARRDGMNVPGWSWKRCVGLKPLRGE